MKEASSEKIQEKPVTTRIRQFLAEYGKLLREIDTLYERRERLCRTYSITTEMSGMPHGKGTVNSVPARITEMKASIENRLKVTEEKERRARALVEMWMEDISDPDERAVLCLRYFDRLDWQDICSIVFDSTSEADLRRMYRLHGSGLLHLAKREQLSVNVSKCQ